MHIDMHIKLFLLLFNFGPVLPTEPGDVELELLQVMFRHGARHPDEKELSAAGNDEYSSMFDNSDMHGQLLTVGMRQEYEFGQMLRKRYDTFLGEFKYGEVFARSTNYDRTKMSLQLVLAGLYPPTKNMRWNNSMPWFPIPAFYQQEKKIDFLDITHDSVCMENGTLVDQVMNSNYMLNKMKKYQNLAQKLKKTTGVQKLNATSGYELYAYLSSLSTMGLPLPSWCTPEDLAQLREIASISMDTLVHTERMRRITVGMTVEEILKNIDNKENNKRKIYLYSSHDTHIGPFTRAHNFTGISTFPEFGSAVIIEKLKSGDGQLYIKMFYWTGHNGEFIPVKLKDCDNICLLSKYRSAVAPLLPREDEKACFSPEKLCHN